MTRPADAERHDFAERQMYRAENLLSNTEKVLYRLTELCPDDAELKALEERHYKLWSDFIAYLRERGEA